MVANTRFLAKYANVREGSSTACQRYYIYEFPEIPVSTTNLPFVIVHDPPAGAYGYGKFRPIIAVPQQHVKGGNEQNWSFRHF
jgi:hypothetical protein